MLSVTFRRAAADLLAPIASKGTATSRQNYTSWMPFEQPNPKLYTGFISQANKKSSPQVSTQNDVSRIIKIPNTSPAQLHQDSPAPVGVATAASFNSIMLPGHFLVSTNSSSTSGVRGESLYVRPYTQFRTGPWRDSYLPNLRLNIAGSPATFGVVDIPIAEQGSENAQVAGAVAPSGRIHVTTAFSGLFKHELEKLREEDINEAKRWRDASEPGQENEAAENTVQTEKVPLERATVEKVWGDYQNRLKDACSC